MKRFMYLLTAIALACFLMGGCKPSDSTDDGTNQQTAADQNEGDHDHDHDHADDHDHDHDGHGEDGDHDHSRESGALGAVGPNNGHLVDFGDDSFKAEWVHYNDNDIIRVFVLDEEGKANRPVKAERVVIARKAGSETVEFELEPESPNENGEASSFMREDKELVIAMTLGVEVIVEIDGETHTGKITPHEPHHH